MGKRFAIVIGVAAAGVMALGTQTALAGGEPVDSVPPDLQLSGHKKQNPQEDVFSDRGGRGVHVKVSCGDEECNARATGKLTNVKNDKLTPRDRVVAPGKTVTMGPELTKDSQCRDARRSTTARTSRRKSPSARRMRPATWRPRSARSSSSRRDGTPRPEADRVGTTREADVTSGEGCAGAPAGMTGASAFRHEGALAREALEAARLPPRLA
jgi:hypothetical protein